MSAAFSPDPARVAQVASLYDARLESELAAASGMVPGADRVPFGGDPHARVVLIKGMPGPAEETGSAVLSGADGEAATRALEALGITGGYFAALSRPVESAEPDGVRGRVRALVEAVDPEYVVALDAVAAEDAAGAFGLASPPRFGLAVRVCGRTLVAVDGLEASLSDPARKRRVWEQFKAVVPRAPLW